MPSQEEYLDSLLKNFSTEMAGHSEPEDESVEGPEDESVEGPEDESMEGPEDESVEGPEDESVEEPDLMSLLEGTQDEDLQEIQALLQKEEKGEPLIDDGEFLNDSADEAEALEEPAAEQIIPTAEEIADSTAKEREAQRAKKAEERKRIRLEKKEERRLAKEARKAEKKAAREEKMRKRMEAAEATGVPEMTETPETPEMTETPETPEMTDDIPDLSDPSDLFDLSDLSELLQAPEEVHAIDKDSIPQDIADEMDLFMDIAGKDEILPVISPETEENALEQIKEKENSKEKKSFFTKILDLLTEENEEEEQGNEDIRLSEENQTILEEMDKEKGRKKVKKPRKKKKEKEVPGGDEAAAESEEIPDKDKNQKKPKKEKKKKKEKPASEPAETKPGKKLSFKKVFPIVVVCASILAVIIIVSNLFGDYSTKREGRKAYYEGDYQTCYQNLYGKTLNESEQVMYSKSESILRIQLWMREYEMLAEEGDRVRALDSLIQSVKDYPTLYTYASEWNAGEDVSVVYNRMLTILADEYGLTEEQAAEIAAEPDDIVYTRKVTAIAGGESYGAREEQVPEESLMDALPEEEGFDGTVFIDNNR